MRAAAGLVFALVFVCVTVSAAPPSITNGEQLIEAMHARYEHNWYRTVTFTEQATTRGADGAMKTETWWEELLLPGKLRINVGSPTSGNARIFNDGQLTSFQDGKMTSSRPFVHMLLVLGFDVYRQDPSVTIKQAKDQGFDLSILREGTWQGKPVYVVGAKQGDSKSKQFWIEKDRLLFVRLIQPDARDATKTDDDRFADYRRLPVGWISARVDFYVGRQDVFIEKYANIKENVNLDPSHFDPQKFTSH
jgi:hypothetical protein